MVMNIEVEVVSDTSVRVSWDSLDIPEITGYTVYYSQTEIPTVAIEHSVKVSNVDFVVIDGLMNNAGYQFQVVATAELDGDVVIGQRSMVSGILVEFELTTTMYTTATSEVTELGMFNSLVKIYTSNCCVL